MYSTQGTDWYESLSEQDQDLYIALERECIEVFELDAEQCQEFLDELKKIGIDTAEAFKDAYAFETDAANPLAVFTKWYVEHNCPQNIEDGVSYDWQATWNTVLKNHFDVIEIGQTYFFQKEESN